MTTLHLTTFYFCWKKRKQKTIRYIRANKKKGRKENINGSWHALTSTAATIPEIDERFYSWISILPYEEIPPSIDTSPLMYLDDIQCLLDSFSYYRPSLGGALPSDLPANRYRKVQTSNLNTTIYLHHPCFADKSSNASMIATMSAASVPFFSIDRMQHVPPRSIEKDS